MYFVHNVYNSYDHRERGLARARHVTIVVVVVLWSGWISLPLSLSLYLHICIYVYVCVYIYIYTHSLSGAYLCLHTRNNDYIVVATAGAGSHRHGALYRCIQYCWFIASLLYLYSWWFYYVLLCLLYVTFVLCFIYCHRGRGAQRPGGGRRVLRRGR